MKNNIYFSEYISKYELANNNDCMLALTQALQACQNTQNPCLIIENGEYHFYPEYTFSKTCYIANHDSGIKQIAFLLENINNLDIIGNNAEFIFHGKIIPFVISNCRNLSLSGINIDYNIPFIAEATVIASSKNKLTISIDKSKHPYRVENNKLIVCSKYWEYSDIKGLVEIDINTKAPAYLVGDDWGDDIISVTETVDGYICIEKSNDKLHTIGNVIAINLTQRDCPAIFIEKSHDVFISYTNVYQASAMGLICQNTKNITLDNFNVRLRDGSDRLVSTRADATHYVHCYGHILVENCTFENQLDDAVNCHGIYTTTQKIIDKHSLIVKFNHYQQVGIDIYESGDNVVLMDKTTCLDKQTVTIKDTKWINPSLLIIEFKEELDSCITIDDLVDNRQRMPEITVKNCKLGNNRARGLLLSTPKKVTIENNTIYSPGTAILSTSDNSFWYEAGAVHNLTITNNIFENCLYSPWGDAVIKIHQELSNSNREFYHHSNIIITGNTFNAFDNAILKCKNAENIDFTHNIINKTSKYKSYTNTKALLCYEKCNNIIINENKITGFEDASYTDFNECKNIEAMHN